MRKIREAVRMHRDLGLGQREIAGARDGPGDGARLFAPLGGADLVGRSKPASATRNWK